MLFLCACQGGRVAFSPTPTFPGLPSPSAQPSLVPATAVPTRPGMTAASPIPTRIRPTRPVSTGAITQANLDALVETAHLGKGAILNLAYSADGRTLAFATRRGLALYNAENYREVGAREIAQGIPLVAFSPDSKTVAAAGWDSKIYLYRVSDLQLLKTLDGGDIGQPLSLVFWNDGKTLCMGTTGDFTLQWNLETGKMKRWYTTGSNAMSDSSDSLFIATSNWEGNVYMWTAADGKGQGRMWRDSAVLSLQFSPDSKLLAAGYADDTVVIWNPMDGKLVQTLKGHSEQVIGLAFSPDSSRLVSTSSDQTARVWDVKTGSLLDTFSGHSGRVEHAAFSADGKTVTSVAGDGIVYIWRVNDGMLVRKLDDFIPLGHAIFSPDGNLIATGVEDGTWRIWRVSDGTLVHSAAAHEGGISALRFSPDGSLLISGGLDRSIKVWNTVDGKLVTELGGIAGWVNGLAVNVDGTRLAASGTNSLVQVWSLPDGQPLSSFDTGGDTILDLIFSPEGDLIFTGGMDGSLKSWETASGKLVSTLRDSGPFFSSLSTSADGRWLAAAGDDRRISVWEINGQVFRLVDGIKNVGVSHQAFNSTSDFLAAAFWDQTLRAFAIPNGNLLKSWNFPINVHTIDFSPDGRLLALSLDDGTVRLWGIK